MWHFIFPQYNVLLYSLDGRCLSRYNAYDLALGVKTLAWSPSSQFLAIGSYDEKVSWWLFVLLNIHKSHELCSSWSASTDSRFYIMLEKKPWNQIFIYLVYKCLRWSTFLFTLNYDYSPPYNQHFEIVYVVWVLRGPKGRHGDNTF